MPPLAQTEAWDELSSLQAERSTLMAEISRLPPPNDLESEQLRETIRLIQACDDQVLEYLLPLQKDIGKLLASSQVAPTNTP